MNLVVYLPLLLPVLVAWAARPIAERGRPGTAALGLTAAAVLSATASVWSLVLLVLTLFDDLPSMVVLAGHGLPEPVPDAVALLATAALTVAGVRLAAELHRRRDAVRRLRGHGPAAGDVVVADEDEPLAVAVPGRPGTILLTTGMVRLLGPAERAAVLAHERAHLAHRHHLLVTAAAGAAAVHPLLGPVRDAVAYLAERWADEDAATAVGDRGLVARAVARAALAATPGRPPGALGVHGGVVVRRVRALQDPAPTAAGRLLAAPSLAVAAGGVAVAVATVDFVALLRTWLAA